MEDTIEGAFINEMREYQPFAKITDKDVTSMRCGRVNVMTRPPMGLYQQ